MDSASAALDPRKRRRFRVATLVMLAGLGLAAAEVGLRWQQARIDSSDELAPGLIRPDPKLGWSLTPYWKGRHQHHDFSASYQVSALGLRADTAWPNSEDRRPVTVVVGDSFTFGFGVDDTSTFVHRLDRAAPGGHAFGNAAIPGYSTDQQALQIAQQILPLRPRRVLLAVYLGNDLLGNLRPVPLQVRLPKPFFEAQGAELLLRNVPVPTRAADPASTGGLLDAVLGPDPARWPWRIRLEQQSELFRLLSLTVLPSAGSVAGLAERLHPALQLFGLLVGKIRRDCAAAGCDFAIVLLAGRSHALQPGSLSAQYQEVLRLGARQEARTRGIPVLDAAAAVREAAPTATTPWFFPHDGHLTAAGHQAVADILIRQLAPQGGN